MRRAAPCWSLLVLLCAIGDTIVKDICHCYDIQLPENYTALAGDLEVTVIDLRRGSSPGEIRLELLEVQVVRSEDEVSVRLDKRGTADAERTSVNSSLKIESLSRVFEENERQIPEIKVRKKWTVLGSVKVPEVNSTGDRVKVSFPCGVITRGGQFGIRLTGMEQGLNNLTRRSSSARQHGGSTNRILQPESEVDGMSPVVGLDVRWPPCVLSISPRHIETYPEVTVTALLQFLPTACAPAVGAPVPETWLDLLSCGHSPVGCTEANSTHRQVVYSEQIRGYPRKRTIILRCELFGIAGHFALALRPSVQTNMAVETQNKDGYLKAVWSEQYIFNVHARSIFPCDVHGGGVPVLFQYPQCILKEDRVRLFSRLRADVASLVPPTTLHYVTEQRVTKGKHSLFFDCDFFSERFVEFCFVYVSQAITGAVSDVRMDCVPTLPVADADSGDWGAWSSWSSCTTTCGGGTRNRFRFCDSPAPRYGAKFCEGPSVQSEHCGNTDWDCEFYQPYPALGSESLPADRPEVMAEVGPGCRCGCVVHLGEAKPRRLLATSSQSCPGRTFWLVQAERDHVIRLSVEHFRFPCSAQWLKVRDGNSFSSTLIGELSSGHTVAVPVVSSSSALLIEFFSDELLAAGQECSGGFLAHAQQSLPLPTYTNVSSVSSGFSLSDLLRNMEVAPTATNGLTIVHGAVALFITVVLVVSGCLGVQYVHRYRKYQLAAAAEDVESMAGGSQSSLVAARSRATSNSTLLSEVISLRPFKPRRYKHSRLQEEEHEIDEEHMSDSTDSQQEGDQAATPTPSQKTLKPEKDSEGSTTASLENTPKASPLPSRQVVIEAASYRVSKKALTSRLSPLADDSGNTSSLDSTTSRSSSEAVRKIFQLRRPSLSSLSTRSSGTLTNGDSPCSSLRSASSRNPKERKDKRNLERLLAGSEFSLSGDADLELDYYDYNVHNASAVPQSYIGMDPAYLIWIPPMSPGPWDGEGDPPDDTGQPNSDCETNDGEVAPDTPLVKIKKIELSQKSPRPDRKEATAEDRWRINEEMCVLKPLERGSPLKATKQVDEKIIEKVSDRKRYISLSTEEKETRVEKSPSNHSVYYDVTDDDIKFADDDEEENSKNVTGVRT